MLQWVNLYLLRTRLAMPNIAKISIVDCQWPQALHLSETSRVYHHRTVRLTVCVDIFQSRRRQSGHVQLQQEMRLDRRFQGQRTCICSYFPISTAIWVSFGGWMLGCFEFGRGKRWRKESCVRRSVTQTKQSDFKWSAQIAHACSFPE